MQKFQKASKHYFLYTKIDEIRRSEGHLILLVFSSGSVWKIWKKIWKYFASLKRSTNAKCLTEYTGPVKSTVSTLDLGMLLGSSYGLFWYVNVPYAPALPYNVP